MMSPGLASVKWVSPGLLTLVFHIPEIIVEDLMRVGGTFDLE